MHACVFLLLTVVASTVPDPSIWTAIRPAPSGPSSANTTRPDALSDWCGIARATVEGFDDTRRRHLPTAVAANHIKNMIPPPTTPNTNRKRSIDRDSSVISHLRTIQYAEMSGLLVAHT